MANIANMGGIFEVSRSFSSSFYDDDISRSLSSCQTPLDNSGLFSALLKFELIGYLGRDFFEAYKEKRNGKSGLHSLFLTKIKKLKRIYYIIYIHITYIELNLKYYFLFQLTYRGP